LEAVEEVAERCLEVRQQEVTVIADEGCGPFVEAGKAKTPVKAATFAPVVPCRCWYLNQAKPRLRNNTPALAGGLSTIDDADLRAEMREMGCETDGFTLSWKSGLDRDDDAASCLETAVHFLFGVTLIFMVNSLPEG